MRKLNRRGLRLRKYSLDDLKSYLKFIARSLMKLNNTNARERVFALMSPKTLKAFNLGGEAMEAKRRGKWVSHIKEQIAHPRERNIEELIDLEGIMRMHKLTNF